MQAMDSIVGNDDLKKQINRIFMKAIKTYKPGVNYKHNTGILFHGVPGVGKSMIIGAILKDYVYPYELFIHKELNKSTLTSSKINKTAKVVDDLRKQIKNDIHHIYILEIDEADDILKRRTHNRHYAGELTSSMLKLIEGIDSPDNKIVLAATNYIGDIDYAIKTRFNMVIEILPPSKEELKLMIKKLIVDEYDICDYSESMLEIWAKHAKGFTGRDISKISIELDDLLWELRNVNSVTKLGFEHINMSIAKRISYNSRIRKLAKEHTIEGERE